MSKGAKRIESARNNPSDVRFDDLVRILLSVGFAHARTAGSHQIYKREGVEEIVTIQTSKDGKAKTYQVKQVLAVIEKYGLEVK